MPTVSGLGMKTYHCACGQIIFFENVRCVACGRTLGFLPDRLYMASLQPAGNGRYAANLIDEGQPEYRKCLNYIESGVCNWMIPAENTKESFCVACRLDEIIPDLSIPPNRERWSLIESAKRRLIYSLMRLKLPLANREDDPRQGLAFRFLSDSLKPDGSRARVMTGHEEGIITLNTIEADDAEREKIRVGMKEPYRTLVGHFRHEIGHYYWDRLVKETRFLQPFRQIFGNERADYEQALKIYYARGAPPNWRDAYITVYATAHPWEDWAETWAHYMHIHDTLEVASDFGLVGKRIRLDPTKEAAIGTPGIPRPKSFEAVLDAWADLTVALNSINRSMGLPDLYPFVLSRPVGEKLRFISEVIAGSEVVTPPGEVKPPVLL